LARAAELLSERELEVFALVGQGLSSVEIANRLGFQERQAMHIWLAWRKSLDSKTSLSCAALLFAGASRRRRITL